MLFDANVHIYTESIPYGRVMAGPIGAADNNA